MKRYVLGLFSRQLYTTAGAEERLNASEVSLLDAVEHSPRKEKLTWGICNNNNNNDPDKVSNGKQDARKGFPRRSDDQKSTPVNVSTHITQRRD